MSSGKTLVRILNGEKGLPPPWTEGGVPIDIFEKAYEETFPAFQTEQGIEFHLEALSRQKHIAEITGIACIGLHRHYSMAPRIRNADNNGILTDEASLTQLVFTELTEEHWDNAKRLVDAKGDLAMFAAISTGIGHIWQTMDMMAFSLATVENRGLLQEILKRYTDWTCAVLEKVNTIGIDFVWSFDDFAFKTGTIYSPDVLREIVLPYAQQVADAIRVPWVFHSDGDYMSVLDEVAGLGMNALNPVEPGCLDIPEIRRRYPELVLIGNVDVDILARGSEEETRNDVDRVIAELGASGPWLPSTSNSIPDYAKPENVRAMFDEYKKRLEVRG